MLSHIEKRLAKIEGRRPGRVPGINRFTDDELGALIAWLRNPDPDLEDWAAALLHREGLI